MLKNFCLFIGTTFHQFHCVLLLYISYVKVNLLSPSFFSVWNNFTIKKWCFIRFVDQDKHITRKNDITLFNHSHNQMTMWCLASLNFTHHFHVPWVYSTYDNKMIIIHKGYTYRRDFNIHTHYKCLHSHKYIGFTTIYLRNFP